MGNPSPAPQPAPLPVRRTSNTPLGGKKARLGR